MTVHQSEPTKAGGAARRRPIEAIQKREHRSAECEQRVRKALAKLAKTGVPFSIKDVCDLAGVGKTFIYDKRHPELTQAILDARNAAQIATTDRADQVIDERTSSWRERARNAEAHSKKLKTDLRERDSRIADLIGQLYDSSGTHLVDEVRRLRDLLGVTTRNLQETQLENQTLHRSLEAARANLRRERERNVTQLFGGITDAARSAEARPATTVTPNP